MQLGPGFCLGRSRKAWRRGEEDCRPGISNDWISILAPNIPDIRSKEWNLFYYETNAIQVLTSEVVTSKWGDQHLFIRLASPKVS